MAILGETMLVNISETERAKTTILNYYIKYSNIMDYQLETLEDIL
jgi:hypothetical protein